MTTATSRTGEERSGVDMSRASPHELAQRPHADGLHSGFAERARGEFRPVEALLEAALMGGLRRDRAQLLGVDGWMTDQIRHSRPESRDPRSIVFLARSRLEPEGVGIEAVEDWKSHGLHALEQLREVRRERVEAACLERAAVRPRREHGDPELLSEADVDLDEGWREAGAHVRVEMGHVDARGERVLDLRTELDLHLFRFRAEDHFRERAGQIALVVEQTRDG